MLRNGVLRSGVLAVTAAVVTVGTAVLPGVGTRSVAAAAVDSQPPSVDVASYMVVDYNTGTILAAQAPHEQHAPASTLKVLTADTLIPRLSASMTVAPAASDFQAEPDGSVVGMTAGVTYSVADLWSAAFLVSGNDAVAELAHLAGGQSTTVSLMQTRAKQLGAYDTVVGDVDGYDVDGQVTSAYDMALFARAGLRMSEFRGYCGLRSASFPEPGGKTTTLESHDPMLLHYPGMIGIKGGITTNAGHTYIGAATRGGHTLIVTVMHGGTDVWDQVTKLLDWGFAADGNVAGVGRLGSGAVQSPAASTSTSTTATPTPTSTASATPTPGPTTTSTATPSTTPSVAPTSDSPSPSAAAALPTTPVGASGGGSGSRAAMIAGGVLLVAVVVGGMFVALARRRRVAAAGAGARAEAVPDVRAVAEVGGAGLVPAGADAMPRPADAEPEPAESEAEPDMELAELAKPEIDADLVEAPAAEPEPYPEPAEDLASESESETEPVEDLTAESESESESEPDTDLAEVSEPEPAEDPEAQASEESDEAGSVHAAEPEQIEEAAASDLEPSDQPDAAEADADAGPAEEPAETTPKPTPDPEN